MLEMLFLKRKFSQRKIKQKLKKMRKKSYQSLNRKRNQIRKRKNCTYGSQTQSTMWWN